jgi:hypothetical protein
MTGAELPSLIEMMRLDEASVGRVDARVGDAAAGAGGLLRNVAVALGRWGRSAPLRRSPRSNRR